MTSIPQDFKIKILDIFVIVVPLEILTHCPDIDISHWLNEIFQRISEKVVNEKLTV